MRAGIEGHTILAGNAASLTEAGVLLPALIETAGTRILIARNCQYIALYSHCRPGAQGDR